MKHGYWIILSNPGGELFRRFADTEDDTIEIAHAMLCELPYLCDGDVLRVEEGYCEVSQPSGHTIRRKS